MALTYAQAMARGADVFRSTVGFSLEPGSGAFSDMESMYRKSTDFRLISDAAGDYASGLSNPEGWFETQLQGYVPILIARWARPTYSNAGVGGDDDPSATLGSWTPPPAVQAQLIAAAAAQAAAAAVPVTALITPGGSLGAGPTTTGRLQTQSGGGGTGFGGGDLGMLPLLLIGGAVLYFVVKK